MTIWQNIYGHEQIKTDLQLLLQENKLPHALLFSGIDGIGKLLVAKVLAKSLLCNNFKQGNMACGYCNSCKMFDEQNHPDFYYLEPEGKTRKLIKIDQIRQLQSRITLSPYLSDRQVVIINDAQYLNDTAGNSLLKTLEEPIGEVFFILITSNKDMILPTILSRCTKIYFAPLSYKEVAKILQQKIQIEEDKAKIIARLSSGSILKAMQFIDDDALALRQKALDCLKKDFSIKQIWSFIDDISTFDRNKISDI